MQLSRLAVRSAVSLTQGCEETQSTNLEETSVAACAPLLYEMLASPCNACCCDTILLTHHSSGMTVKGTPSGSHAAGSPLEQE